MSSDEESVYEPSASEQSVSEETSAQQTSAQQASAEQASAREASAEEASAEQASAEEASTEQASAKEASAEQIDEEVEWNLYRPELIDVYHKLHLSSEEILIGEIRKKLQLFGPEAVEAFKASTFGTYLNYSNYITQSQRCIHHVVSRQVTSDGDPDQNALWFDVAGEIVKFSRIEFALISGLRFGPSEFNPYGDHEIAETSFYTRGFDKNRVTPAYLWNLFTSPNFDISSAADCVKLCKLMIATHIVLGFDPNNWKIPDWIWVLLENEEQWERFPWGSLSFQILVRAIGNVKRALTGSRGYHLHANTLAFLGWIYTAFPDLGRNIGGLRPNYQPGNPRGEKFIYHKSYVNIDINEVHQELEPSLREMNSSYYLSLEPEGSFFEFIYDPDHRDKAARRVVEQPPSPQAAPSNFETGEPANLGSDGEAAAAAMMAVAREAVASAVEATAREAAAAAQAAAREAVAAAREAAAIAAAAPRDAASREAVVEEDNIRKRKRVVEEISEDIMKKVKVELKKLEDNIMSRLGEILKSAGEGQVSAQTSRAAEETQVETNVNAQLQIYRNPEDALRDEPMFSQIPSTQELEALHAENLQMHEQVFGRDEFTQGTPFSTPSSVPHAEAAGGESSTLHDNVEEIPPRVARQKFSSAVLKSPFRPIEVRCTNFQAYMRKNAEARRNVGLPFPVDKEYFEHIKSEKEMMEMDHMEPYVTVLAKAPYVAKVQGINPRNIVMGLTFMKAVEDVWRRMHGTEPDGWEPDMNSEEVVPVSDLEHLAMFAEGLLPEWGGLRRWIEADQLVKLCHFSEHWAVCALKLRDCTMVLWDSNEQLFEDHHRQSRRQVFRPLGRILPQLLKHIGYYNDIPGTHKYTEWTFSFPPARVNKLQQQDNITCGPLALKCMENRLTDSADKKMTKKQLVAYRAHIAETIFKYSTDENTIEGCEKQH